MAPASDWHALDDQHAGQLVLRDGPRQRLPFLGGFSCGFRQLDGERGAEDAAGDFSLLAGVQDGGLGFLDHQRHDAVGQGAHLAVEGSQGGSLVQSTPDLPGQHHHVKVVDAQGGLDHRDIHFSRQASQVFLGPALVVDHERREVFAGMPGGDGLDQATERVAAAP